MGFAPLRLFVTAAVSVIAGLTRNPLLKILLVDWEIAEPAPNYRGQARNDNQPISFQ
jgi:hypothetical protein